MTDKHGVTLSAEQIVDALNAEKQNVSVTFSTSRLSSLWLAGYDAGRASRDAEVEKLREDAERYRWFRENSNDYCLQYGQHSLLFSEDELDAAIDQARKA